MQNKIAELRVSEKLCAVLRKRAERKKERARPRIPKPGHLECLKPVGKQHLSIDENRQLFSLGEQPFIFLNLFSEIGQ